MFFEHLGRYFAAPPRLEPLPIGTACPRCGASDIQLWKTSTGQPSCIAQQTIVRKRRGRATEEEPCRPTSDQTGMVAMAEGTVAIAGPYVARISTRLLPDTDLPAHVEVRFPRKGLISQMLRQLIEQPPKPPFVVIIFGKNASFAAEPTVDPSRLIVCGPDGFVLDTPHLKRLLDLFDGVNFRDVANILALRDRLATGSSGDADAPALSALKGTHPHIVAALRLLPSPGTPQALMLRRLMEG